MAADAVQAPGTATIQEVVVTAQKTETTASKTPIALSVFSGSQLQQQGVVSVANLDELAPGVVVANQSHGPSISIRGVTTTDTTSKGTQDIVFTVDGIPIGRPQEMALGFFDTERVEVLRGPQGTLYGTSSTAGAVNIITAKPKDAFDASGDFEIGNYNTRRGDAMVNIPITDNFAVRAAANFNYRDGFLTPILGQPTIATEPKQDDENNMSGRITALWKFDPNGSLQVTGTFGHVGGTGNQTSAIYDRVLGSSSGRFNIFYNPYAGLMSDDFVNFNAELNYTFGPVHVVYDGARLHFMGDENNNPSSTDPNAQGSTPTYNWSVYHSSVTTDSHELRLSNAEPGRFEWLIGGSYFRELNNEDDQNWQSLVSCSPSLAPSCSGNPNPDIVGPDLHETKSVFGQADYHVTDQLKLTGGLRYTSDDMYRHATVAAGGPPFFNAQGGPCGPVNGECVLGGSVLNDNGSEAASKLTWRIAADYQLTPGQMVYGYVATGYKAGGFNDLNPQNPKGGTVPYGPEYNTAYEIGYKGRPMSNLQFSTDLYYYDYSQYQLTGATFFTPNFTGGAPVVLIYTTIAPAKLFGWENDLKWNFTPNDTLNFAASFEEGYFENGAKVGFIYSNQVNWAGKSLDNLPKYSGTVSYEHRWTLNDGAKISARVGTRYSSGYFESNTGGNGNPFSGVYSVPPHQFFQPAFTRSDMDVSYTTGNGKYSIDAFVRNLEDKVQILNAPSPDNGPPETADGYGVRVSDPRTFGVRVSMRY
ncbi:MAG TPA: TonB-dependent receptor [Caulobacteraceae bacterium]|nr:TonB-dependent receptor [Caulobacteraceae bacterium]